jgi:hypothetical protein
LLFFIFLSVCIPSLSSFLFFIFAFLSFFHSFFVFCVYFHLFSVCLLFISFVPLPFMLLHN